MIGMINLNERWLLLLFLHFMDKLKEVLFSHDTRYTMVKVFFIYLIWRSHPSVCVVGWLQITSRQMRNCPYLEDKLKDDMNIIIKATSSFGNISYLNRSIQIHVIRLALSIIRIKNYFYHPHFHYDIYDSIIDWTPWKKLRHFS